MGSLLSQDAAAEKCAEAESPGRLVHGSAPHSGQFLLEHLAVPVTVP
jgi:hypothetical protein